MKQYNYPVRYFSGTGVQIYPQEVFNRKIKFFDELTKFDAPIVGETGIDGMLIDFNYGLRLQIPEGNWHVRIVDLESDYVFVDDDLSAVVLISIEKFYIEWEIALWLDGEPVFYHQFDPRGQKVHFNFPKATLGDNIIMLTYIEAFRRRFDGEVSCSIPEVFNDIIKNYYPKVHLTSTLPGDSYACFQLVTPINLPFAISENPLRIPLLRVGNAILRCIETPSKVIYTPTKPRSIKEKYVCIGVQASTPGKSWLNPDGWDQVVEYLKSIGYRVLCIDRYDKCWNYGITVEKPAGAEDFTGDYTLLERINQLAYADFFMGVSSGLAWLAWSIDIPVVMISGITEKWNEFATPYRILNLFACHGCYNACNAPIQAFQCPLFKGTERAYECSKNISARQVIDAVDQLIADNNLNGRN